MCKQEDLEEKEGPHRRVSQIYRAEVIEVIVSNSDNQKRNFPNLYPNKTYSGRNNEFSELRYQL